MSGQPKLGGWELAVGQSVEMAQQMATMADPNEMMRAMMRGMGASMAVETLEIADQNYWSGEDYATRNEIAALLYKLLWEPNPLQVTLPAFAPATIADTATVPAWLRDAAPQVVGLGLLAAPEGKFRGREFVTLAELDAALARAKAVMGDVSAEFEALQPQMPNLTTPDREQDE